MHSAVYEWIWFGLGMMIEAVVLYILILVWLTMTLIQDHRSAKCKKAKPSVPITSWSFQSIWMEFGLQLRLVGVRNFMPILYCPFNIQGRKPYWYDFVTKTAMFACIQIFTDQFCFKLGMMIGPLRSTFLYQFGQSLHPFKVTAV